MENALAEIAKERNRLEKENQSLNHKIDGFLERVERHQQEIYKNEELIAEYDQIIKKVEGESECTA